MTLVHHARTTLDLAELGDIAFVWSNAVAVRLESVGCARKRVTHRRIQAAATTITELRLQTVVVRYAEIHDHVYLANAAGHRQNRTREIRCSDASRLARCGTRKRRGRVQIDSAIEIGPVLANVVSAEEEAFEKFTLGAESKDLAARIHQFVRIVRQLIEV